MKINFRNYAIWLFLLTSIILISCNSGDINIPGGNGGIAGEINCTDGIDNDGDTLIDCEDIDCILAPACNVISATCEDFINAVCERSGECNAVFNFENCVTFFGNFTNCNTIHNLLDVNQCIADLDNFDCVALTEDTLLPDTCTSEGTCDICESNADCPVGLSCNDCFDNCTGAVDRCIPLSFFFADCIDGFF